MKIHIIIAGWDKERAVWGCTRIGADRVYLVVPEYLKHDIDGWVNEKTRKASRELKKKFSRYFPVKFVPVIYDDYVDCFKNIIKVIWKEKEKNNEVYVNISSGSHVAASAAIFAASLTRCKAYYVIPERYDEVFKDESRFVSYGGKTIVPVPLLPISGMSETEIEMLKLIGKHGRISAGELAEKGKQLFSMPTRSKFNYYINKLEGLGLVENRIASGKLHTRVTDAGKMMIEAFN
ncbi:MAG: hypothetical protein HYW26_03515 [Candidatus Aenigmarchaeota archaeon]|nr:hypothetical protein [Candidatus Aenigmarchaeota archaeon]